MRAGRQAGNDMTLTLKSLSREKPSGVVFYPQCLEHIVCPYVPRPPWNEEEACRSQYNGYLREVQDDKGCVKEYACFTLQEQMAENLKSSQPSTCPAVNALAAKAVECQKAGKNWNPVRGSNGCLTDISCSEPNAQASLPPQRVKEEPKPT